MIHSYHHKHALPSATDPRGSHKNGSSAESVANMAPLSDTSGAAVMVGNSPFHLFHVTGSTHLFRSNEG